MNTLDNNRQPTAEFAHVFGPAALRLLSVLLAFATSAVAAGAPAPGPPQIRLDGGVFVMGSESGEADERPAHRVRVAPFWIDTHEVTQHSYEALMDGANPSRHRDPDRPVEQVAWIEAIAYCNARSRAEGRRAAYEPTDGTLIDGADGYRLPTEAQWEYACRAGHTGAFGFHGGARAMRRYAWTAENAGAQTQPVATKQANDFGLYDLHGNVWEWCHDRYEPRAYQRAARAPGPANDTPTSAPLRADQPRVLRGGDYASAPQRCRAAYRFRDAPVWIDACATGDYGFRCVRPIAPQDPNP